MTPSRSYPGIGHAVLMALGMMFLQTVFAVPAVFALFISSGKGIEEIRSIHLTPAILGVVNVLAISCIIWWGYAANKTDSAA